MIYDHDKLTDAWELLKIEPHKALTAFDVLVALAKVAHQDPQFYADQERSQHFHGCLDALIRHLERLELKASICEAHDLKLITMLEGLTAQSDVEKLAEAVMDRLPRMSRHIQRELEERTFYCLSRKEAQYIELGLDVFDKRVYRTFPKATGNLEEAVKCLAFERYTACVFHLARPMETAVRMMGKHMGVTVKFKRKKGYLLWGQITYNMTHRLEKLKKSDPDEHVKWLRVYGMIECVGKVWRNETMHPGPMYTQEQAEQVLETVKLFLKHLAEVVGDQP
ncbi:MAG: hypothetical protein OXI37_02745 [Gammaproteobacteria bacterium]|nr:hypothetical protein [Gammaproteobacteria bacterium]